MPGGFALATRLERIELDGTSASDYERWPTAELEETFSLGRYLKSLFYTEPGYFRVIVFVLSDRLEQTSDIRPSSDEAMDWTRSGMIVLPHDMGIRELLPTHRLNALIYEFKREPNSNAMVLSPGRLTGRKHIEKAQLASTLLSQ